MANNFLQIPLMDREGKEFSIQAGDIFKIVPAALDNEPNVKSAIILRSGENIPLVDDRSEVIDRVNHAISTGRVQCGPSKF